MLDRRSGSAALLLAVVAALLLIALFPAGALATTGGRVPIESVSIADAPPGAGEDCVDDPDAHPGVGLQKCPTPFSLASLVPFVTVGVVALLAMVVGWYLVMRRRVSQPFLPDDAVARGASAAPGRAGTASAEWWTCRNCGSTNMNGSARCYKCGSWQR